MDHRSSKLAEWLARQFGVPVVDLTRVKIEERAVLLVPARLAQKCTAIPEQQIKDQLRLRYGSA